MNKRTYIFKLDNVLKKKSISISKLIRDTKTDYKVIHRIKDGSIKRIDLEVLARLCDYLDCEVSDILDYKRVTH